MKRHRAFVLFVVCDHTFFDSCSHCSLLRHDNSPSAPLNTAQFPSNPRKSPNREKAATVGDVSYRLYWTTLSTWAEAGGETVPPSCVMPLDGLTLMDNPNCLFSSVCGMDRAAEGRSDWVTFSNQTELSSFEVGKSVGGIDQATSARRYTLSLSRARCSSSVSLLFGLFWILARNTILIVRIRLNQHDKDSPRVHAGLFNSSN